MRVDEAGVRRRSWVAVAALVVLVCALPVPAAAAEFTVNSTADEADATPGTGGCLTVAGKCTLRAAIEESNSSVGEFDEIVFDEAVFDGQVAGTIVLGKTLPPIVDPGSINGKECSTAAGVNGPCVGINGPSAGPALTVENSEGFEIWGLAVTGAKTGVQVDGSLRFKARASWFGVKLDGSAGANTTGVLVDPGSNEALIGGEGPERGNVFANSSEDGLDIHGARNVRVLGNFFGVEKDGVTQAANKKDIEISGEEVEGKEFKASGNTIGTRLSPDATATPACDGGCNLISGAGTSGIDLEGGGGEETPAVTTTIVGNYIGLNAAGTAAVPNGTSGIHVGPAAQTVIGGPKAGEANRVNGGDVGVEAGPAAADLVVRGNLIGIDAAGAGILAPPAEGIAVKSEGLSNPALEAAIVDNEIRMEGGTAIAQGGLGARISGNEISGAETGIKTFESTEAHGNLIEGNSIEALEVNGILVENDLNEILGNEVSGSGGAGMRIHGSLPFGVTENLVGGNVAADENVINGSGGAAIEISDVEGTQNEVARNRGLANGGLFIDLLAVSPGTEPNGPNGGVKPPAFSGATQASASGSGAAPGARVRVFRKQIAAAGELQSFLGEATVDGEGNWKVTYSAAIPAETIVAATQTSGAGGTSELATATTAGGSSSGGGEAGGSGPKSSADLIPPRTKIAKGPGKKSRSGTARFRFDSDELGSTFQCKLDGQPFSACRSPKKYQGLKPGKHVFKVRAIDPAGNVDPSPAKKEFTVLASR